MERFYCLEAPRDDTAHSNSVRNPLTSGGGINVAAGGGSGVMTVPICPGTGGDVGLDVPTCLRGMGGGPFGVASSRHNLIRFSEKVDASMGRWRNDRDKIISVRHKVKY
jgi:hypothetical protein